MTAPDAHDLVRLIAAAFEAESALQDYIQQLELKGASLNYGRKVLTDLRAALKRFQP